MTLAELLNAEWFGNIVIAYLVISILKNGWQLLAFMVAEILSWAER